MARFSSSRQTFPPQTQMTRLNITGHSPGQTPNTTKIKNERSATMNFKAAKQSLIIIVICCCISLYGAISYLEPISSSLSSSNLSVQPKKAQVGLTPINCHPPQRLVENGLTYAAIVPGVNDDLVYSVVHALSGLQIVNIDPSINSGIFSIFLRQTQNAPPADETIIRHTTYPYMDGRQPPPYYSKDGRVSRAFILLQNPLRVISDRFQSLGGRDWKKWSELNLDREIASFHRFLCYWFDRNTPDQRLVVTYEGLLTEQTGVQTITALSNFVGGATNTDATCIWKSMMDNTYPARRLNQSSMQPTLNVTLMQQPLPERQQLSPMLVLHHPFTAAQLGKVAKMLDELAQRYADEEAVHAILVQYHGEVLTVMSQTQQSQQSSQYAWSASNTLTEPLQICGRLIPFPLESEIEIAQLYASECPLFAAPGSVFTNPTGLLLMRGYDRFGRTGNNLIEFLHALQYGRENNVIVGIMLDSWPMALITKFWMAFPTDNLHNEAFLTDGIIGWKDHIEHAFCIKVFLNEEELAGYDNIIEMTARELFMFRYKAEVKEYIQFQLHNIRMLFRSYNTGVGKDVKNRNVGNLCSVVDGVFGEERQNAKYSVIHSRSLEGAPGLRLLGILSGTSGCDPVAALNMEPEYIKAILGPVGLLNNPILFISDNQRPEILEKLLADEDIGPQIRVVPKELSWVGGDLAVAIMANAFIGNPASTFSGFIAKSRIALGFGDNFLFRVKKGDKWMDSCEDRCIFYKWVMRSMA